MRSLCRKRDVHASRAGQSAWAVDVASVWAWMVSRNRTEPDESKLMDQGEVVRAIKSLLQQAERAPTVGRATALRRQATRLMEETRPLSVGSTRARSRFPTSRASFTTRRAGCSAR